MSKDIWHDKKEKATEDKLIFAQHKSLIRDKSIDWFIWEPQEFTDEIREDVIAWTYLNDLLALETELIRTRKALDAAVDALDAGRTLARIAGFETLATGMDEAVNKITALEQKDVK